MLLTAREWFEKLEEPYKSQAIRNSLAFHPDSLDKKHVDLHYALRNSFLWPLSPEGPKYWDEFVDSITPDENYFKINRQKRLNRKKK